MKTIATLVLVLLISVAPSVGLAQQAASNSPLSPAVSDRLRRDLLVLLEDVRAASVVLSAQSSYDEFMISIGDNRGRLRPSTQKPAYVSRITPDCGGFGSGSYEGPGDVKEASRRGSGIEIHRAAPERERRQTCLRIPSISLSSKARIVVLLTFPAPTTLAIAPIIDSSEGASIMDTRS